MQNKNKKNIRLRRISFKWKAIIVLEIFVIVINSAIAFAVWNSTHATLRNSLREELIAIASSSAAVIDVEKHENIQEGNDFGNEEYAKIQILLQKIKKGNSRIDDIYTMRKTDNEQVWQFVVSAAVTEDADGNGVIDDTETAVAVGEEYDVSSYPQMQQAFDLPIADEDTSCDKWGCWLSGYAPIYDENGNAVAIVGVDMSVKDVLAFEKEVKMFSIGIVLVLIIFMPFVFYAVLSYLSRPMKKIMGGIQGFQTDMKSRIDIRTGDEFEMIAVTFNTMADELQQLYGKLEEKVKEKTSQLEVKIVEIQQRNAKDEALLASVGDGLVATDKDGKIIMMNRHAVEIMGVKDMNSLLHADYCERANLENDFGEEISYEERPVRKALATGAVVSINCQLIKEDGLKVPLSMTAAPIIMEGKTIGAITVFRDITKEKEIDRAKSEFVSLASHQLRTPLSSIKWYAEMLLLGMTGKVGAKQRKYLRQIYSANQHMVELVNSLLNVSRIEMGTFSVDPEKVDINEVVQETVREVLSSMHEKKINLEKIINEDAVFMNADPALIRIIMQNLISNAVKYTPEGGKVCVSVMREESRLKKDAQGKDFVISVSDTGLGIPAAQQGKIFSKLFRADNAREQVADGNGLGLYIIKSILESSGGAIDFRSKENVGTTFTVRIPAEGMKQREGEKRLNLYTQVHSHELQLNLKAKKDNNNSKSKNK